MEVFYKIVALLGGLAMFLYGMRLMGDGLKSSSGGAMRAALARVTNRPVMGFILGALVTCMIQSSTATIVLTVGLVGAGFLTFRRSIGIVLGANVGTAITAQIIRLMDLNAGTGSILYFFKADNLAPLALVIGIVCIMFVKRRSAGTVGTVATGFGILFMGLIYMGQAVGEMGDALSSLLTAFEGNYFLGFLAGVAVTGVIQSSSAVVGILQSLASSVGVRFCGVFAVIIGVNIGDCLTTFLVSRIGATPEQVRTVLVHVIYNVFAAVLIALAVSVARVSGLLGDDVWYMTLDAGGVANVHGLFRLIPAVLLLPLARVFAGMAERIVPDKPMDEEDADILKNLRELDMRLITNPGLALNESAHLIGHMADVAMHNYEAASDQLFAFDPKREERIRQREDMLDRMADASNRYIISVSPHITREADNRSQDFQVKALTCFERIGDLAVNITGSLANMRDSGKSFSDQAMEELRVAFGAVGDILELSRAAYKEQSVPKARRVEPTEEVIDELIEELRGRHVYRMTHGLCDIFNGIQFQEVLQNLERISDQCSDLAVYLLGRTDDAIHGREHQYLHVLHHANDAQYLQHFQESYDKYFGLLPALVKPEGPVDAG